MSFELQPTLKGETIELRPLQAEDFAALYAVASDPLIWEQHPNKDRYKEQVFKEFFRKALESGGALSAIDSKNGRVIGSSRFHGHNPEKSEIEIGWTFLARSHGGGIYNKEMKKLMLEHAFRFVENIVFLIGPQNFRSQRAVEKIGGVRIGSRPDGNRRDRFVFQITSTRWREINCSRVLQPEEGHSFWQPEPANGYVTVKVSPRTVPGISFSQGVQIVPLGSRVRKHAHENQREVIYCLEGTGRAEVDGKEYAMVSGTVIVLEPKVEHCFINTGTTDLKFIWTISEPGLEEFFRKIGKLRLPHQSPPNHFDRPFESGVDGEHGMSA